MFHHFMKRHDEFDKFGPVTLVKDTFAYEADPAGWFQYMNDRGYTNLPDQVIQAPQETTYEEFIALNLREGPEESNISIPGADLESN